MPQNRVLLDDFDVVVDIGRRRHGIHQLRDIGATANFLQLAAAFQMVGHDQWIESHFALASRQLHHGVEDRLVCGAVECVFKFQGPDGGGHGLRRKQHGSQNRDFRLLVMWFRTVQIQHGRRRGYHLAHCHSPLFRCAVLVYF